MKIGYSVDLGPILMMNYYLLPKIVLLLTTKNYGHRIYSFAFAFIFTEETNQMILKKIWDHLLNLF